MYGVCNTNDEMSQNCFNDGGEKPKQLNKTDPNYDMAVYELRERHCPELFEKSGKSIILYPFLITIESQIFYFLHSFALFFRNTRIML